MSGLKGQDVKLKEPRPERSARRRVQIATERSHLATRWQVQKQRRWLQLFSYFFFFSFIFCQIFFPFAFVFFVFYFVLVLMFLFLLLLLVCNIVSSILSHFRLLISVKCAGRGILFLFNYRHYIFGFELGTRRRRHQRRGAHSARLNVAGKLSCFFLSLKKKKILSLFDLIFLG